MLVLKALEKSILVTLKHNLKSLCKKVFHKDFKRLLRKSNLFTLQLEINVKLTIVFTCATHDCK